MDSSPLTFNLGRYIFADASLRGWWLGHFVERKDANLPALFGELLGIIFEKLFFFLIYLILLGYLADKSVTLPSVEFDFATQWKEAFAYSNTSNQKGKAVLVSK